MGRVVNKNFEKVRKDITKKSIKLFEFLISNFRYINSDYKWSSKQNQTYDKLANMCYDLLEEIDNLDEIEVPEFNKK